jgi:hypothetical protein
MARVEQATLQSLARAVTGAAAKTATANTPASARMDSSSCATKVGARRGQVVTKIQGLASDTAGEMDIPQGGVTPR